MNRRSFIKSAAVASVAFPTIANAFSKPKFELEKLPYRMWGEWISILHPDELKQYGIRSAIYTASCVHKNGTFGHEDGFVLDEHHIERFIGKTYISKSLPHYWVGTYWYNEATGKVKERVQDLVYKLRDGKMIDGVKYSLKGSIDEMKENMEYVCMFGYSYFPEVKEEAWPAKWMPVFRGLSKKRYQQHLKELNEWKS